MSTLRLLLITVLTLLVLPLSSAIAAPANDDRATPATVNPNGQVINGSTVGATVDGKDHQKPGEGTHSLWYSWTAPQNGMVTITNASSAFDPVVAAYTDGTDCCPYREDLDGGVGDDATISFYVIAGRHYEILVDGETAGGAGSFTLTVAFDSTPPAPGNDDFGLPEELGSGTYASRDVHGLFATQEALEPNHRGVATSHSTWFRWTPVKSGGVRVKLECAFPGDVYGTQDPIVAVYTGSFLSSLSQVAYTDTKWLYSCTRDYVQFYAVAGTTYRIAVDAGPGQIGDSGPLSLNQDTKAPTVSFDGTSTYGPNQVVKFDESESSKSKCKLDGGGETDCYGEYKLVNAKAGNHTLSVRPTDYYGNVGDWTTKTFKVDATQPQTVITGGPAKFSNLHTSKLTFTSSKPGSTFQCQYPGKAWFDCGADGTYTYHWYLAKKDAVTVEVRAKDALGNVDATPSGWSWTHDFTTPKITFPYQTPKAAAGKPLVFSWSVDEESKIECSPEGGAWVPCSSPYTMPARDDAGNRQLRVRAIDKAGNEGSAITHGYQNGPLPTSTIQPTSTTTTRPTTTTQPVRATTPTIDGRLRPTIELRVGVRTIDRAKLARTGLRFTGTCRPGCRILVELRAGKVLLAKTVSRGSGTLKLTAAGRRALKKVRRGSSLTFIARAPGTTMTQRLRVTR